MKKQLSIFIKDKMRQRIIALIDLTDYIIQQEKTEAIYLI